MSPLDEFLGKSPGMVTLRESATRCLQQVPLPPVLIQGATGTGKSKLARLLHATGPRAQQPFIDVDVGNLPETIIEVELFGYERGAFRDARESKAGRFQAANHGTIFLDEVESLPEAVQAKLLRVIEDHSVRRLGATRAESVDVWIIAANRHDLAAKVRARCFRENLYHRLSVVTLQIPAPPGTGRRRDPPR